MKNVPLVSLFSCPSVSLSLPPPIHTTVWLVQLVFPSFLSPNIGLKPDSRVQRHGRFLSVPYFGKILNGLTNSLSNYRVFFGILS